jgi:hypothetical protein
LCLCIELDKKKLLQVKSGFQSVIGTLWVVDDAVAKHVVEAFYENMFKEGLMDFTKAAWALNHATNAVKTKVPLEHIKGMKMTRECLATVYQKVTPGSDITALGDSSIALSQLGQSVALVVVCR